MLTVIFVTTYASKENRKRISLIAVGFSAVIGFTGLLGHTHYRPYLDQASYSNPLIRDREPRLTTYIYYRTSEQSYYSQLNYLDSLRNMELYEEEQITDPVIYLGQGEYFHYFECSSGQLFKQNRQVELSENIQKTQLVGSQFTLKDESFQGIGFKNPENIMFEYIEIPATEQGKAFEPEDDTQIPRAEEKFHQWNF